jgi:hypothetical protein
LRLLGDRVGRTWPLGASIMLTRLPQPALFGPTGALVFGSMVGI